jgi:hypothetical protein
VSWIGLLFLYFTSAFSKAISVRSPSFPISHINFQGRCSADKDGKNVLLQAVLDSRNVTAVTAKWNAVGYSPGQPRSYESAFIWHWYSSSYYLINVGKKFHVFLFNLFNYFEMWCNQALYKGCSESNAPHFFFLETIYSACMKFKHSTTGCFLYTCYFST